MLDAIKGRRERDDEGFTLIELMVVLLIIAILMAIAIPTFLGARNTANARAAQSNLTNALTAEQTYWTNNQAFTNSPTALAGVEGSLTWTTTAATTKGGNTVTVTTSSDDQAVELQAYASDGNCYEILQDNNPAQSFTGYAYTS
ncbi:MAG: type II secretion system protein, partial [Acidimicrobiales bacterium]